MFKRRRCPETQQKPMNLPPLPPALDGSWVMHKGLGPPRIDYWSREKLEKKYAHVKLKDE